MHASTVAAAQAWRHICSNALWEAELEVELPPFQPLLS